MADQRILTPSFLRLAAATGAFFIGFAMLIPILPRYLVATGKNEVQVGLLLGAFSVTALVLRPVVGREIDSRGRRVFLVIGLGVSAIACAGYVLAEGFVALLALRLLHGAAIACFYPSAASIAADLAPPARRAEVMSYFSMFLYAGLAIGPVIGESMAPPNPDVEPSYFTGALLLAAGISVVGFLAGTRMPSDRLTPEPGALRAPLVSRAALFPAMVLSLAAVAWAATAYIPLYAQAAGAETRLFFFVLAATVIVLRAFVGKAADVYGRSAVIVPGLLLAGAGMLVLTSTPSVRVLVVTALVFGIGWGALFPALMTLAIDRVSPRGRGSALGTFTAAFDLAFGGGQALLGAIWGAAGFRVLFMVAGTFCFLSCATYVAGYRRSAGRWPALDHAEG